MTVCMIILAVYYHGEVRPPAIYTIQALDWSMDLSTIVPCGRQTQSPFDRLRVIRCCLIDRSIVLWVVAV